jgi:Beta-1,3-glucanase
MTVTPDGDSGAVAVTDSGPSGVDGSSGADSATSNSGVDASSGSGGGDGAAPAGFWDTSNIPAAKNVMTFKFLNRTNGKYADSEMYWSFKNGSISETHSIADEPTYDMPANASGRMYFYLCGASDATCASDPTKSKYYDFIEHTIGAHQYNGNTTRVDAFGIKIAMLLHCSEGADVAVGEDYETFAEDRAVTFQKFLDAVPAEFKPLAQAPNAPYRIVQPGAAGFDANEPNAHYYDAFVDQLWAANGITMAKPGANGSGLASYPDLSAAIYRHVGAVAGSFNATGKLLNKGLWADASTFYTAAPADYYAQFWHAHALGGKAYGFPYDDVGGYSSYISRTNPQYMLVAIGW